MPDILPSPQDYQPSRSSLAACNIIFLRAVLLVKACNIILQVAVLLVAACNIILLVAVAVALLAFLAACNVAFLVAVALLALMPTKYGKSNLAKPRSAILR